MASYFLYDFVTVWLTISDFWEKISPDSDLKFALHLVDNFPLGETHLSSEWSYAGNQKQTSQSGYGRPRQYGKNHF